MPLSGRKANSITCDSLTCCLPPLSHMFVCLFVCLFTCLFVQQKKTTALPFTEYLLLPPPLTQRHTHLFVSFLPVCMFVCQPEKTTAFLPVRISPAASPPPSGRTLPVVVLGSKPTSVIVILPQANSLNSHQKQNRPQKCVFFQGQRILTPTLPYRKSVNLNQYDILVVYGKNNLGTQPLPKHSHCR